MVIKCFCVKSDIKQRRGNFSCRGGFAPNNSHKLFIPICLNWVEWTSRDNLSIGLIPNKKLRQNSNSIHALSVYHLRLYALT
jgi:hypothetical protein